MLSERHTSISYLSQGDKFIYKDSLYMKVPLYTTCYGQPVNAINLSTGAMKLVDAECGIDLETVTRN